MIPLPAGLVVLSREGCGLCQDMRQAQAELERSQSSPAVTGVDVGTDPEQARGYGVKVTVLLLDGTAIYHYTLDSKGLVGLLRRCCAISPR